jgi:hypothetical protein
MPGAGAPARAQRQAAFIAAVLGALFALWLYGARVVDPRSAAWLMQGDPAQHYVGSAFFLAEPWHWPPGRIDGFGDEPTSVVFTDSIPIVALVAKLFGVPAGLQYFGLWMVLCHALSGWFGARFLQRIRPAGRMQTAWAALFFVAPPVLLLRAYGHEALMAHFLVIAALERALAPWRWGPWLVLAVVATLVHPYMALMVGTLAAAAGIAAIGQRELPLPHAVVQGAATLALLLATAWCAGYFVGSGEVSAGGHGFYSANALTWLDPMHWREFMRFDPELQAQSREWSVLLPGLPQATGGQYEGFAYLGAGAIAAGVLALAARRRASGRVQLQEPSPIPRARWVAVVGACGFLALWALSLRASIGPWMLPEFPVPALLQKVLGVFRASGRLVWPLTYLVMGVSLVAVQRLRGAAWLIPALLVLQAVDLQAKLRELRVRFRSGPPHIEALVREPVWRNALQRCPRLELVSAAEATARWSAAALAAAEAGARFYPAPTARRSAEAAALRQKAVQELLATNAWRNDTVYLLSPPLPGGRTPDAVAASLPAGLRHLRADGYELVVPAACETR